VDGLTRNERADIRNAKIGFVFRASISRAHLGARQRRPALLYDRTHRFRDIRGRAREALALVGLADRMDHQPHELSGGQQQRVAIARALVSKPSLLLADEPTGNLDSRTAVEIMAVIQQLQAQGNTIVIVTHELDIARFTQRIIELRDGRIIRDEPVDAPHDAREVLASAPPELVAAG
jgi:putative ABC transport system ATP-binding protein